MKCKKCHATLLECEGLGYIHPDNGCHEEDGVVINQDLRHTWNQKYPYKKKPKKSITYEDLEAQHHLQCAYAQELYDRYTSTIDYTIKLKLKQVKKWLKNLLKK